MLTKAEIAEATGSDVINQEEFSSPMKGCSYSLQNDGNLNLGHISKDGKVMFEAIKGGKDSVGGVGDDAFLESDAPSGNLVILSGDQLLYVQPYYDGTLEARLEAATKLGKIAVPRL